MLAPPTDGHGGGAAFFDLDRTLIRRSSMLALAPALRRHGLIGWGSLARATAWHAVYLIRGVSSNQLAQAADQTFRLMKGWPVHEFQQLIAEEIEPLAALAFPDAIQRMRAHQARGEQAIVVSASLVDLVDPLAQRLGLDGTLASHAAVRDGRFSGRVDSFLYGSAKAAAVRAYADEHGIDLSASSAYTDSRSDIELLEAVGHPFAVNPDRSAQAGREGPGLARPALLLGPARPRRGRGSSAARVRQGNLAQRRGVLERAPAPVDVDRVERPHERPVVADRCGAHGPRRVAVLVAESRHSESRAELGLGQAEGKRARPAGEREDDSTSRVDEEREATVVDDARARARKLGRELPEVLDEVRVGTE